MKKLTILLILIVVGLNVQSQQLHDYNPYDYNISDNCTSAQSDLKLSGAPSDAVINGVNLYFEINHPKHSDLKIWITAYYSNAWHDVILYNQGSLQSTGLLKISKTNITQWNGASPNQTWYLVVKDCVTGNVGYISFFELWVNYNSPPKLGIIDGSKDFGDVGLGTNPSVRSFPITIKNTGQGTLTGTIVSQDSWLSLNSTSFSLTENQTKTFTITATTSSLSAGSHTGYLKITSNGGNATHPAALVNIVSPVLGIIDGSKDFGDVGLGTNPSNNSFPITIKNTGKGTLTGTIVSQDSWLSLSSSSFSLTENQTKTFTITATTSSLSAGSHTGYLKITSNGGNATHPAAKVNIVSPVLGIIDGSKDFGDVGLGTNPSNNSFPITIKNTGKGILNGNIESQDGWLSPSSSSFSLTENQTKTFTITATTSSLSAGSHTGYLKITSNGGGATHPAAMVNIVSPELCLSETAKDFGEISQGSNPDQNTFTFSIENCGKGILTGNITTSGEWLSVDPTSFNINESQNKTITVTATTNGLLPGDFTSNITITSNGGNSSWQIAKIKVLPYKPVFTFVDNSKLFGASTIYKNSTAYIYGYVQQENSPPVGTSFNFNINSNNINIPAGLEYLGDGILKLKLNIAENINQSNLQISLSNAISNNGTEINFNNIPPAINAHVLNNQINQSIDIFAGGSVGVKLIAGGVGAGPSVAAASLSLNGTGGMGINFHQDAEGNEFITRRFETGVGLSVETPSINAVVGDIQAGVSANVMVKGVMGQTMYFPNNLNTELVQKAKAAYILETFTMGGVELSPFASVFLKALKNSLISTNPDLNEIYSDLYYSNQTGNSIEGEASIGFSVASGASSEQTKLDIVEFGGYIALTKQTFENVQDNDKSFRFGYASGFDISALDFKVANVDFGDVYDFKFGTDFSLGANYNPSEGIKSFELSFGATPSAQVSFASFSSSYNYDFIIPKSIIAKNQNSDNLIGSVVPIFIPGLPKKHFKVGMNYFTENLDEVYADNPNILDSYDDHIIMQKTKSSSKGLDVDAKIGLDAALGVGAGLKLGIHFSYLDEMYYPQSDYIVANNQILPIAKYNDIPDEQRLFSIQNEIHDIFQGTVLLIKEQLNQLLNVIENQIESNLAFVIKILNGEAQLAELKGTFSDSGLKWITRTSNPTTKSVQKSAFLEPKIINAYSSRRIVHLNNKSANLAEEDEESVLYFVSENINVSLVNSNNQVINEFEPVTLSISIDNDKMNELGFGESEKQLAKMYQYDADNLVWIELTGDSNSNLDTVTTQIIKSASYAIGIELNSISDNTAPDIQDYYPKNEDEIEPVTNFWAKLYESPIGVGIDFSQTIIKIDDVEVDAVWNPVENIISFESLDSLSIGQHTFEVIVKDYNGNTNSVKSTFTVSNLTGINSIEKIVQFDCYPVPMSDILNIEINSKSSIPISMSIYNQIGQLVSSTFECQPINGYIKIQWDRTGNNYQRVKSGIYFVRIKQDDNIMVKKIVLE